MKAAWMVLAALPLVARGQAAPAAKPVIQVDYSNPGLSPSQWTITLHPDGSGHFRSPIGQAPEGGQQGMGVPGVDRDIQVSAAFTGRVFAVAQRHDWFNESCESHLKVAFQGWKMFSYAGPQGNGSCTFNYSNDKEIQTLGDSFVAVAVTILAGARLEMLLQHDRLGLDAEMEFLTAAVGDGRAQQVCAIREILERLAQDDSVLERARKQARALLALEST